MMKLIVYFIISHLFYTIECGRTDLNDSKDVEADVVQIIKSKAHREFTKPQNPPKYFALDLDGTFYTDNEEAMNKNLKALKEVIKLGYTPFFCTGMLKDDINLRHHSGRTFYSALYLFDNLEKETGYNVYPGIYTDGSTIFGKDGIVVKSNGFSPEALKLIYDYVKEKGLLSSTIFYSNSRALKCVELVEGFIKVCERDKYPPIDSITEEILLSDSIITIEIYSNDDLTNIEIPGLDNGKDFTSMRAGSDSFDITPPGGNKAEGLKILMEHLGEDQSSCGYIGDNYNDVEAMKLSNLSFAVNNAHDYVKREAKYVVNLSNNEAAVAYTLQQVYGITL